MSQSLSRSYLRGLPVQYEKAQLKLRAHPYLVQVSEFVTRAALEGKTSYMFSMPIMQHPLTAGELLPFFEKNFPDCTISYEENRVVIDWS
jgi:hypothetical protein